MKTILMAAITIDGKIAKDNSSGVTWSSKEDKKLFSEVTKNAGVVIFGRRTFQIDMKEKPLPNRLNVVLSQSAKYPTKKGVLICMKGKPHEVLGEIESLGYDECVIGGGEMVYSSFMNAGVIDELLLTIVPRIFGKGVSLFSNLEKQPKLTLAEHSPLGTGELLLRYITSK